MFERLALSRLAGALANHAADRQAVVAENVANADTPGYRARDLRPFAELMERGDMPMAVTRAGHQPEGLSAFHAFVDGRIGFLKMAEAVEFAMDKMADGRAADSMDDIIAADEQARALAEDYIAQTEKAA